MSDSARRKNGRQGRRSDIAWNAQGRACGKYVRDELGLILTKSVDPGKHMLLKPPAYATDAAVLEEAWRLGATRERLVETIGGVRTGRVLEASKADFDRHGIRFDRGWGEQIALPLEYWRRVAGSPANGDTPDSTPPSQQLSLFPTPGGASA